MAAPHCVQGPVVKPNFPAAASLQDAGAMSMAPGASADLSDAGTCLGRDSLDGDVDLTGTSPASSSISTLFAPSSLYGTSPDTPLHNFMPAVSSGAGCKGLQPVAGGPIASAVPPHTASAAALASSSTSCTSAAVTPLPFNFCAPVTSSLRQQEPSAPPLPAHLLHAQPSTCATSAAAAAAPIPAPAPAASSATATTASSHQTTSADGGSSFLSLSVTTLLGCCEMLGHHMEDRSDIARQQDLALLAQLQGLAAAAGSNSSPTAAATSTSTSTPLRDASQAPLFTVAPLDVLVTRDDSGRNQFHVIEINGTGISGLTNMSEGAVEDVLRSLSELGAHLASQLPPGGDCVVLVASSGTESYPPVSRTLHEKVLYIEALRRGFAAAGRPAAITNMTRLEKRPESMPPPGSGPLLVLGYMKQFRAHFMADAPTGRLLLLGRQVHAAINDRFVLNTVYQFNHCLDLAAFRGFNAGFAAGADKGVAYELYNQFFGSGGQRFPCMAPSIHFRRAHSRDELVAAVQQWLATPGSRPAVIKPQGTGCGHGIEFFFEPSSWEETAAKVDRALHAVAANYNLQCGGLPFTVCEYLDTATVHPAAAAVNPAHVNKAGHKFELRIVVYRSGGELRAFPSIAKVAREAFDPSNPDNKKSLINNITTSAKETAQCGQEFLLPLCRPDTLQLLGISPAELSQLCAASTAFIRFTLDTLQDNPAAFSPPGAGASSSMMQQ
ncbi:hypothetical protein HYH02_014168 [Chlamydomonas schloesseri]|uniref:Uncharacterized protein n=1 Tax=Chlamydomonas schloesseri TaxID=2026947 RepID=A0A835VXY6_9CHLO|nr:hypothetical protein HYH02_014168 [Chlamydomonas schloesseri]|eukprot:KAG2429131.1 hypothetical protein HYH02_014168 [Chlamydomonas schloesseri]